MKKKKRSMYVAMLAAGLISISGVTANVAQAAETGANTKAGEVSTTNSKGDTSKPIDFNKAQNMSPKERVDALTANDKRLHDKEVTEGHDQSGVPTKQEGYYTNANINKYIEQKGFKPAKITEEARIDNLPKYSYKSGKYVGVAIHETANPNSNIYGEVNYMYGHYYNAFVHAYVDGNRIIQTAPADYLAWGAGPGGNPYFYQIELVRAHSLDEFARSVNNDAYLTAYMLKRNGLKPTLADNNGGRGTVISHNAISRYYGGSDHADPYAYFASWNYDMNKFFQLVQKHYDQLSGKSTSTVKPSVDQSPITTATYTVKHGDTLYDIAKRSGASIDNIKKWSGIKSNVLSSGQVLRVKAPAQKAPSKITTATYTVKHGDTLYDVSKRSGVSMSDIKKWSKISSNVLHTGQVLQLKAPAPKTVSNKITTATYTVKHGDTLYDVSKRSGVSMDNIKKWSKISSNVLHTGQVLQLKAPAPTTTSDSKANANDDITSKSYVVRKGDTLYSIAKRANLSVSRVKSLNNLKSNTIAVGQTLYLAPTHTVKKGETLYRIAKDNNISVSKLKTLNGLKSNTIKVGQKLFVK